MKYVSKRKKNIAAIFDPLKFYKLEDAIAILKKCPSLKFDSSVDVAIKVGVDTSKSEQMVRGTVSLPHGTGKKIVILVFAKGEKAKEALDAGADYAGAEDLLEKVKNGWTDFDAVISTPDMMREVGKLGKVLGPKGLMPTPKAGTVTNDLVKAIQEMKAGKIEFKMDKGGVIQNAIGKLSFEDKNLKENATVYFQTILRSRPPAAKGTFIHSFILTSTMGPGLKIDTSGWVA